jgi:hypothetical protein
VRNWIEPGPEVVARMALASEPDAATVACYTLTRGAERAWTAINDQLTQTRGDLFWIGGEAGSGKTHFLNYAVALSNRAAASDTASGRYLTVIASASARANAGAVEQQLLDQLALQLAGDSRGASLWRRVSGAEGLTIAFDYAKRQGVKGVTAAVDLGERDGREAVAQIRMLRTVARELKQLRLIVIAAGRAAECGNARSFVVAPEDNEKLAVICGRARRLNESAWPQAAALYHSLEAGSWEPRHIYPLHPAAAEGLKALSCNGGGIGAGAALLREAIVLWDAAKRHDRLLTPAELLRSPIARRELERYLGEAGRGSFAIAHRTAANLSPSLNGAAAGAMVDTMALHHVSGAIAGLSASALAGRLPAEAVVTVEEAERLAKELAAQSKGVIRYEGGHGHFNPHGVGTPATSAFNTALSLARCFDSSLAAVSEAGELRLIAQRLEEALARALERCQRNREVLTAALQEGSTALSSEQRQAFEAYNDLAESGVEALIELAGDPARREVALKLVADYEAMAVAAMAAPRLRTMREYLEGSGLASSFDGNPGPGRAIGAVETECQLLKAAVAPAALFNAARNLEALEARFHRFKWSYIQLYREAHAGWRREMEQLAGFAGDARLYRDALERLNRIAGLGEPIAQELGPRMEKIAGELGGCDAAELMVLEVHPRCAQCDFVIGAVSPRADLLELFEQVKRALSAKLAQLSQSAIARLIEAHDRKGRLEGFLKITQAAQTDALVRVLDDKLAAYLAELLNENQRARAVNEPGVQGLAAAPVRRASRFGLAKNLPGSSTRR